MAAWDSIHLYGEDAEYAATQHGAELVQRIIEAEVAE